MQMDYLSFVKKALAAKRRRLEAGVRIWWRSMDGLSHGPVRVDGVLRDQTGLWVACTYGGLGRLTHESLVTKIESAGSDGS
jgi:hypothetical protein